MYTPGARNELTAHFQSLASPTRLLIVERLVEVGEASVKQLAAHLRMSQPRVSWHLAILRRGGALRQRRAGRQVHCSLDLDSIRRHQAALEDLLNRPQLGVNA